MSFECHLCHYDFAVKAIFSVTVEIQLHRLTAAAQGTGRERHAGGVVGNQTRHPLGDAGNHRQQQKSSAATLELACLFRLQLLHVDDNVQWGWQSSSF